MFPPYHRHLLRNAIRIVPAVTKAPQKHRHLRAQYASSHSDAASADESSRQPAMENYYSLLNLPQTFFIHEGQLKNNYRNLMNQHHPDKFHQQQQTQGDDDEKPQDFASLVTLAYDTLKRPHTRAQHLLALETGVHMDDDHQLQQQNGVPLLDTKTLMEIMQVREVIDETAPDDLKALKQLLQDNQDRIDATSQDLEQAFQQRDFQAAMTLTAKLQYWHRIQESVRDKMHLL
jgi:molecular chaperone HscB